MGGKKFVIEKSLGCLAPRDFFLFVLYRVALLIYVKPVVAVPIMIFTVRIGYGLLFAFIRDFGGAVFKRVAIGKLWFN